MRGPKIEVYRDAEDKWRWHYIAKNGRKTADSGQGYYEVRNLVKGIEVTWPGFRVFPPIAGFAIPLAIPQWELSNGFEIVPITVPDGVSLASRRRP